MKKVEIDRQVYQYPDGKKVIWVMSEWRFTDEEKEAIRDILKNVKKPKDSIEPFISHLRFFCEGKKWLLQSPHQLDLRLTREKVLTDCLAALHHLKHIERGKVVLWTQDTLKDYGTGKGDIVADLLIEEMKSAWEAVGPLEKFIKLLENHHQAENKKRGRKKADSDAFIKKLAEIYTEHIGKPSAYEDGPFFSLVQTVLEILGLPFKEPRRAIREALTHR